MLSILRPTNHPVPMAVHIQEQLRRPRPLDLREDHVAVAGHAVVLDIVHDLVVPGD